MGGWYTTSGVAKILKVPARTVRGWVESGHLPAVKIGPRLWLVDPKDLKGFKKPVRGRPVEKRGKKT